MSIALLEDLLAFSNKAKWLAASIFVLLSLPVLLPLLLLCSFLGLMLLLPLCCALVGFLSWQRLRQPTAAAEPYPAPIRDEKQEKQIFTEGAEEVGSESSTSATDYEEIAEIYRSKDSDDLSSKGDWPVIDFDIESFNGKAAYYEMLLSDDDYSKEAASLTSPLTSPKLNVEGCDVVEEQSDLSHKPVCFSDEQACLSDILLANVEQPSYWYQEMQLELEKYEALHALDLADKEHTDWFDTGSASHIDRQVDQFSAPDASSPVKNKGKRGKASSISSLLSATTSSGSVSMTSTVSSTCSSSSPTWSACSEESQANLSDGVPSKKGSTDGFGRKGSTASNYGRKGYNGGRSDRSTRVLGAEHQENGCAGQGNKQTRVSSPRRKVVGASARLLGAHADCGRRGCVKASKELAMEGAELHEKGRRLVCKESTADSIGRVGEGRGTQSQLGAASRVRAVAGGKRVAEAELKRVSSVQGASNYRENSNNKSSIDTARLSVKGGGAGLTTGGGGAVRAQSTCPTNTRRHVTGGQTSATAMRHVMEKRKGHVTGGLEAATSAGGGGGATSEVEDVRRRLLHVNSEDVYNALPPYAYMQHASLEYPQLLEFWRGIERAFTRPTPRRGTSL